MQGWLGPDELEERDAPSKPMGLVGEFDSHAASRTGRISNSRFIEIALEEENGILSLEWLNSQRASERQVHDQFKVRLLTMRGADVLLNAVIAADR